MPASVSQPSIRQVSGRSLFLGVLMSSAAWLSVTPSANATDAESATDTAAAGSSALEEITVTATRREENIDKVPVSVTAFSQEMIDQKGIKDFQDVVRFTPGVSIDTSGTNAISIRGISSSGGAGTTGIYIDDTPIQMRALGFNPDDTLPKTFDLDRVEVLRGPQGTLFGAGSEGGTVRYIMTQPSVTTESTYSRSEVSFTRYGQPSGEVGLAHGGPIIDDVLGYRASIWYRYDGGWINRIDPTTDAVVDHDANHANTIAARFAMLIQPIEGVKITPSLTYQNSRKHDVSTYWPAYSDPGAGEFNNATPERIADPDEYYLPALKVEVDLGKMTFISNTSYYHRNELTAYQGTAFDLAYFQSLGWPPFADGSGGFGLNCGPTSTTPVPPCSWYPLIDGNGIHLPAGFDGYSTPNRMTNQQRTVSQEFRLQSNDADSKFTWTGGLFWQIAEELSIEELIDPRINQFFEALYGESAVDVFGPYYSCPSDPADSSPQTFPNCDIYYNNNRSHDRQIAGFGEVTYAIVDQLKLTVGGRYAKLSGDLSHYSDGLENEGASLAGGSYKEHSFTPKVSLSFQADPQNLFYATYAKGFRPGGFNPPLIPACGPGLIEEGYSSGQAPFTYGPDSTQSYEVGSKNNLDNVVRIATSVYYIKWKDIQQNVYIAGNCALQFTDNLGTAVAWGGDIQAEIAMGGGFSLEASLGYTDARFTADSKGGLALNGDAIPGEAAINYAPGTNPPLTIALGPQYSFKLANHDSFVRLDWEYAGRNPWLSPVQDPNSSQYNNGYSYTLPATSFFSMRGGMTFGYWQVAAFCDNLLDSHTTTNYAFAQLDYNNPNGPPSPQANNFTFRPRTIGLTATFRH
jgi:outer membrane receptor protein involved in Fe transport